MGDERFLLYFSFLTILLTDSHQNTGCNIQMFTKLSREPRLIKKELDGNSEEIHIAVKALNGSSCLKMRGGISVLVIYKKFNSSKKVDGYIFSKIVPSNALVEGDCEQEDFALVKISWNEYSLVWSFAKTPGRKRWYVAQIDLIINTRTEGLRKFAFCGKSFTFSTPQPFFPTPLGYSHKTSNKTELFLILTEGKDVSPMSNFTAKIYLKENFRMHPFLNGEENFGPLFDFDNEVSSNPLTEDASSTEVTTTEFTEQTSVPFNGSEVFETTTDESANISAEYPPLVVYSLHDFGPYKCAILKADGLIEISIQQPNGQLHQFASYLPAEEAATVEGSCLENEAWMRISWDGYEMNWIFMQEAYRRWWVTRVELKITPANAVFSNIFNRKQMRLLNSQERLINRKIGCVFQSDEFTVNLSPDKEYHCEVTGKIHLRKLYLAAFPTSDN